MKIFPSQPGDHVEIPMSHLATPAVLESLLHRFAQLYPGCHRAAVASQWSMDYLTIVLSGVITSALKLNKAIEVWKDEVALVHDNLRPIALNFPSPPPFLPSDHWPRYAQRVVYDHVEPVFIALSRQGKLSVKVLWNNFVAVWDACFERLRADAPQCHALESAQHWMDNTWVSKGKINLRMLQCKVESPTPELNSHIVLRKHCCLHFQLHAPVAGQFPVWCDSCPKLHQRPDTEKALYLRQIHLENLEHDA